MMKKIFGLMMALAMVIGLSLPAHATLILRGTDNLGHRLIYDDDLNITWYDFTSLVGFGGLSAASYQMMWADALSVTTFGGTVYNDWRLPSTVDGYHTFGYDGTTTGGYNITSSEMGHLFYTELGNLAPFDSSGNPQAGSGLTNTGDFQNLHAASYWSGTVYGFWPGTVWYFDFANGYQAPDPFATASFAARYGMAVRPGDVSAPPPPPPPPPPPVPGAIPEPSTILLLGAGLAGLGLWGRKRMARS